MRHSIVRVILVVVVLATVIGCGGSVLQKAFQKDAAAPVKKIALLKIQDPAEFVVINENSALPLIAETMSNQLKGSKFTQQAKARNVIWGQLLAQLLVTELTARGYETVYLADQRPQVNDRRPDHRNPDYSQIKTDADAILDIGIFGVGYLSTETSNDYRPWARVIAHMVSVKNQSDLYFQYLNYGARLHSRRLVGMDEISADTKYAYPNFDALMNESDAAVEGLQRGASLIAARIAEQLK